MDGSFKLPIPFWEWLRKGGGIMPKLSERVILALIKAVEDVVIAYFKKGKWPLFGGGGTPERDPRPYGRGVSFLYIKNLNRVLYYNPPLLHTIYVMEGGHW